MKRKTPASIKKVKKSFKKTVLGLEKIRLSRVFYYFSKVFSKKFRTGHYLTVALIALVIAANIFYLLNPKMVLGQTYLLTQNDWSVGAAADTVPAPSNQSGWNKFASSSSVTAGVGSVALTSSQTTFNETFTGTAYKDATATAANWNTSTGQLEIPSFASSDISTTIDDYFGSGSVFSSVLDPVNNVAYLAGYTKEVAKYNITTGAINDLTATVAAKVTLTDDYDGWGTAYDSANGDIYMCTNTAKYFKIHTANDSVTDMSAAMAPAIANVNCTRMYYNAASATIYISGESGKFGKYVVGDTATNLTASISGWGGASISDMVYNPGDDSLYFVGSSNGFAKYSLSGAFTNLKTTVIVNVLGWTGSNICLTVDKNNNVVYIGNNAHKFASYTTGGVATDLSSYGWNTSGGYIDLKWSTDGKVYATSSQGTGLMGYYNTLAPAAFSTFSSASSNENSILIDNTGIVALYFGGNGISWKHAAPACSTCNAVSLTTDSTVQNIRSATLTKNDTPGGGTVTYKLSNDGGSTYATVTPASLYTFATVGSDLRFKITLTGNATVQDIAIAYNYYPTSGSLTSSKFDSVDATTIVNSLSWTEDASLPAGTTVTVSVRTADSSTNLTGAFTDRTNASSNCTKVGGTVTCSAAALPADMQDGSGDRWFQYQIAFTSTGAATPTVSSASVQFVINAAPEVRNVTAAQNADGTVTIHYEARDIDTAGGSLANQDHITPQFEYWNGSSYQTITTLGVHDRDQVPVNHDGTWNNVTHTATWSPMIDYAGQYMPNTAKIRVTADDGEGANRYGTAESATYTLDTLAPSGNSITVDATTSPNPTIHLTETENNPGAMQVSATDPTLASTAPESFSATKNNLTLSEGATVYAKFTDAYNNASGIVSATIPATPTAVMIQDTSNIIASPALYRLFVAWKAVGGSFASYRVHRSTSIANPQNWDEVKEVDAQATNYYIDTDVTQNGSYYYYVDTVDGSGNISFRSQIVNGIADGAQSGGEGGGGVGPAPVISHVSWGAPSSTAATVTWDTDTLSDSVVQYSGSPSTFTTAVTVGSLVNNAAGVGKHSVMLSGLLPNHPYYFRVTSTDINNKPTTADNGGTGFTFTTPQGPIITNTSVEETTNTTARVSWTTNIAASTELKHSIHADMSAPITTTGTSDPTLGHTVIITNLNPGTLYFFYVRSVDGSGNETVDDRIVNGEVQYYSFTTTNDLAPPAITGISVRVQPTSSDIIWTTDKVADSQVEYGLTTAYGTSTALDATLTTRHVVTILGLASQTAYDYRIRSRGTNAVLGTSANQTFTTSQAGDATPPVITGARVTSLSLNSASINWATDEPATSYVDYGATNGLGSSAGTALLATAHSVTLDGLAGGAQYFFRVRSADAAGNSAFDNNGGVFFTFTTAADVTAPVISNPDDIILMNSFRVIWSTNELADSQVEYGLGMGYGSTTTLDETLVLNHTVTVSSLDAATAYHYRIKTKDASGIPTVGPDRVVTTAAQADHTPPLITGATALAIGRTTATVAWTTDEKSTSEVLYGPNTFYAHNSLNVNDNTIAHSVDLIGLTPGVKYYYKVESDDGSGNIATEDDHGAGLTFTTVVDNTPPVINGVTPTLVSDVSAVITWTTDENSTSQVEYGLTTAYGNQTAVGTTLTTVHSVTLNGLTNHTPYLFKVVSSDAYGNSAFDDNIGVGYAFTTATTNDTTPPSISGVSATNISLTGATIVWATNESADSSVQYGSTIATELNSGDPTDSTMAHSLILSGLSPNVLYYFKVLSKDAAGNLATDDNHAALYTFTTAPDITPPATTAVVAALVSDTSAVITWRTDENATSQVVYGTSLEYGSQTVPTAAFTATHSVTLNGLTAKTPYFFKVVSADAYNNTSTDDNNGDGYAFTTTDVPGRVVRTLAPAADTTPPNIYNLQVGSVKQNSAIVSWQTDENAYSIVKFGPTAAYGFLFGSLDESVSNHEVTLAGLNAGTIYHFMAVSADASGNKGFSNDLIFATLNLDGTAPEIPVAPPPAENQTPAADTNTPASPAVSEDAAKLQIMSVLSGLLKDPNLASVPEDYFTTTVNDIIDRVVHAPSIVGIAPKVEVTGTTARVSWTTDKKANGAVAFVEDKNYNAASADPYALSAFDPDANTTVHGVDLLNLSPATTYHYQVRSKGLIGAEAKSDDATFATASELPIVSDFKLGEVTDYSAALSWTTNIATNTLVRFKNNATGAELTQGDTAYLRDHVFKVENLEAGVSYTLVVNAQDQFGNNASSAPAVFFTSSDTTPPVISKVSSESTLYPGKQSTVQTIVSWDTDEPATTAVHYQQGLAKDAQVTDILADSTPVTRHTVVITKFLPATVYKFWVESADRSGNTTKSNDYLILTPQQKATVLDIIISNFEQVFGWTNKLGK